MRLVVSFSISDGCTYSCDVVLPVVYESGEAFLVDFEAWCLKNKDASGDLAFAGHELNPWNFFENDVYYPPSVETLDEWFAEQEKMK